MLITDSYPLLCTFLRNLFEKLGNVEVKAPLDFDFSIVLFLGNEYGFTNSTGITVCHIDCTIESMMETCSNRSASFTNKENFKRSSGLRCILAIDGSEEHSKAPEKTIPPGVDWKQGRSTHNPASH